MRKQFANTTAKLGAWAAISLLMLVPFEIGCSQQTGVKIAQEIVNYGPAITSAVNTISVTASMLQPEYAPIFVTATAGFDAAAALVNQYAKAYLANPSASVLANLQTAIMTLEQNVNGALLQAVAIKDPASQKLAIAAINALATVAMTVLGLVQSISGSAQLKAMAKQSKVTLARVRPLLDNRALAAAGARYSVTPDQFFAYEAQAGF